MQNKAMQEERSPAFDFDEWCALAQKNPEEFEKRRRAAVEEVISSSSTGMQQRLRQLQWRIDMERRRCKTPMMSCIKLFDMMWDFVHAERGFLHAVNMLEQVASGTVPVVEEARGGVETAVLPFGTGRTCSACKAGSHRCP